MQAKENYRQSGNQKVLDMVLSNYGKRLIGLEMCGDGLLHGSVIKIDFKQSVSSQTSDYTIQLNILLLCNVSIGAPFFPD